jgi:molybdopterin converting factor subunit 1
MQVQVLYFAILRERLGLEREAVTLEAPATVASLWAALEARHPALEGLRPHLRVAVNEEFTWEDAALGEGDEVALIPPVAGGAPRCWLQAEPLDAAQIEALVARPAAGAIVTFRGAVRDLAHGRAVEYLEYEVYPSMAQRRLEEIAQEVEARWPDARAAIVHRYGRLQVGEDAVVIAVSHPHRAEAFEGCRHAIERIKEIVPIWKKEVGPDGASWVGFGS